ncbi:ABC transporter substrate-binding protein [Denitratisoma oestradiolicum]|nr:ABC transporter substrate binding protein [Denitratisoma oestradiolicum]
MSRSRPAATLLLSLLLVPAAWAAGPEMPAARGTPMLLALDTTTGHSPSMRAGTEAIATGAMIAVIYPESAEPYRSIFTQIIEGIEDKARNRVTRLLVGRNSSNQDIANELRRQDVRVVIALGRNGLRTAMAVNGELKIVAGGLLSLPEAESRKVTLLSLAPDPGLLFERLKSLMPEVHRVHVVFDPNNSGWLIRLARDAARATGLELVAQEAGDLGTALGRYQSLLATADPKRDALWLPQDSTTVDESTILPLVLQESWSRNLAVFSSNLAHARRGALFSLYPDTTEMGRNLALTAMDSLSGTVVRGQFPLRNLLLAVNMRTASHLGLKFSERQQQTFHLTFPEP